MSFLMSGLYEKWVDDFEHNALTSYYSGATGSFNIQTSRVNQGSYALEGTSSAVITSRPGDGLRHHPGEGDYFKVKMYLGASDAQQAVGWCAQDESNANGVETMYYVAIDNGNQNCNVWSYDGSSDSYNRHIRASYYDYSTDLSGQWLTVYLEHQSTGDHYVELQHDDESVITSGSGTPAISLTSGAVKHWFRGGGPQFWDAWEIVN